MRYQAFRRLPSKPSKGPRKIESKNFPAPTKGWVANENIALATPLTAFRMDSWFPEKTGCRIRAGSTRHATIGSSVVDALTGTVAIDETTLVVGSGTLFESELAAGNIVLIDGVYYVVDEITSDTAMTVTVATHATDTGLSALLITVTGNEVETEFSYLSGLLRKFFASDETNIFDITTPTSPLVPPAPAVSGQTSGYYSSPQFTTAGGTFLYALNGTDDPQLYDGSTWTAINALSTPAITNVTSSLLSQGWVYRDRLFFVEGGSMNVWYPAVGSLGGALDNITLQGIYRRGGSVLFGSTWSLDSGAGIDDKAVIVSTEGEVAIFEGSNPSGTTTAEWNLVGVYDCARPLGKNAWMRVGGDLLILTEEGVVPLTAIIQKDPAALALSAVSRNIEPEWRRQALARSARPWEMVKWTEKNMGIVNVPAVSDSDERYCYVVNLESGAWARFPGWDTRCIHVFDGNGYFGTNDGRVMLMESGGSDDGEAYECVMVNHFDAFGAPGFYKTAQQIRASFIANRSDFMPLLSASVDFSEQIPSPPDSIADFVLDVWDVALWDIGLWDSTDAQAPVARWDSVGRSGFTVAWQCQITCATTLALVAELRAADITFETGDLVV